MKSICRQSNTQSYDEEFKTANTLCEAKTTVRNFGICHSLYSLYTTVDRVCDSIKNGNIWLTRMDSDLFDDTIEHRKYGDVNEQTRLFIKCFSYGGHESAAMWGLYCPPTYQAIRVLFPGEVMSTWKASTVWRIGKNNKTRGRCEVFEPYISDIVYASVRRDETEPNKSNYLFWNSVYTVQRIKDIENSKAKKSVTGFVKDDEWKFENETRLFVKTRHLVNGEHIAISIPEEVIQLMSFTLSPWLSDEEQEFVRGRLSSALRAAGRNVSADNDMVFQKSALRDGLGRWKKQRGL